MKNSKLAIYKTGRFKTIFEGDPQVLRNIFENPNNENSKIKPLLIAMSGVMRGVAGGAQVTAMYDAGLHKNFSTAIGISTGAPIISYFLSGEPEIGTSIYYEDLPDNAFISFKRYLLGKGDLADIDMLCDIFAGRRGYKALNISALKENPVKAFAVATEYDTAYQKLLNLKTMENPIIGLKASVAMPGVYNKPVHIGTDRFVDGGAVNACLDYNLLQAFESTDILVLTNHPLISSEKMYQSIRPIFFQILYKNYPLYIQKALRYFKYETWKTINALRKSDKRVLFVWSSGVKTFDMDAKRMREGAHAFYSHMRSFMDKVSRG